MVEKIIGVSGDWSITTSPDVDDKLVDNSPDGPIVKSKDSWDASVVSEEEWNRFAANVHFQISSGNGRDAKIVELLLEKADPTLRDSRGNTPLHLAASCGHEDVVKILLRESKVGVTASNNHKNSPLHLASRNGHENVVDLLLQQKYVKAELKNEHGKTPLYYAADTANEPILMKLLAGSRVDEDLGKTTHRGNILHLEGRLENLRNFFNLFRKWSADRGGTWLEVIALHLAATLGMGLIIKTLLENQNAGVNDVDDYCQTVLHYPTTKVI